jgi:hypothetical protein
MALVTTFVLLICIIGMLWFKLRKRAAPSQPAPNEENWEPTVQNVESAILDGPSLEQRHT